MKIAAPSFVPAIFAAGQTWYVQPSVTPRWALTEDLEIPGFFGFSGNGQYRDAEGDDIFLGFVQTGLGIPWPLDTDPEGDTRLSSDAGIDAIFVPDEAINGLGNVVEVAGKIGLNWTL